MKRFICAVAILLLCLLPAQALAVEALILPDADAKALIPVVAAYTAEDWLLSGEEVKTRILGEMMTVFALDEWQALNISVNMEGVAPATIIRDIDAQVVADPQTAFLETAAITLSVSLPAYVRFGLIVGSYAEYFVSVPPLDLVPVVQGYSPADWSGADAEGKKRMLRETLTVLSLDGEQIAGAVLKNIDAMVAEITQTLESAPGTSFVEAVCAATDVNIAYYIQFGLAPESMRGLFAA